MFNNLKEIIEVLKKKEPYGTPLLRALLFQGRLPNRYTFRSLVMKTFRALDFIFPKDHNLFIFEDTGKGDIDNLYDYIKKNKKKARLYKFETNSKDICKGNFSKKLGLIKKIYVYLKAKTIILSLTGGTVGILDFSKRKTIIQLWHGNPFKKISYYDKRGSTYIASSKLEASMISYCTSFDQNNIYLLGRVRNEDLIRKEKPKIKLKDLIKKLPNYEKIILLCPTYRHPKFSKKQANQFLIKNFDIKKLNQFLKKNKAVLLMRAHYLRNKYWGGEKDDMFKEYDRIFSFGFNVCPKINKILSQIDILVTDYSSIFCDYLLLNRPMIFSPYDLEEYENTTGLLYDNYDFWTPGPKVFTFKEFLNSLEKALKGKDGYEERRMQLNKLFNSCQTENTSERVFELIEELNKSR